MSNNYGNYGGNYPPPPGGSNQGQGQGQGGNYPPPGGNYPPPAGGGYPPPAGGTGGYGQPYGAPPNQYSGPNPQYGYQGGPPPPPEKKSNATLFILLGVAALAVIAIGVVAFLVLGRGTATPTPVAAVSPTAAASVAANPAATTAAAVATTAAAALPTNTAAAADPTTAAARPTTAAAATAVARPTTARATTAAARPTTAAAPATTRAATNPGTGAVPLYPGARAVQIPEAFQTAFKSSVGSTYKSIDLQGFVTADSADKIKSFYMGEFQKGGWTDLTSSVGSSFDAVTAGGGFAIAYTKAATGEVAIILNSVSPSLTSGLGTALKSGETLLLVINGTI